MYAESCTAVARDDNSSNELSRTYLWQRIQKNATTDRCTPTTLDKKENRRSRRVHGSRNSHYLTYIKIYDPQLQGCFMWPWGHPLNPFTATSSDHRGTLVHRRPTTWQNRHADKTNRTTTSKQKSKHAEDPQKRSRSWRRFPKTVQGVQKSPKTLKSMQTVATEHHLNYLKWTRWYSFRFLDGFGS